MSGQLHAFLFMKKQHLCAFRVSTSSVPYSHTVKENAAQRSDAHSQPAHRFSGWKSPCAQRGQIWYHSTAGKGGSKGQYWYSKHFCLGKSLRECKQLLLIVWGHIQSQVLLCYWSWIGVYSKFISVLFYGKYLVSTVTSSHVYVAQWTITGVIVHIHTKCLLLNYIIFIFIYMVLLIHTRKCEFMCQFTFWTHSSVSPHHQSMCYPHFIDFF